MDYTFIYANTNETIEDILYQIYNDFIVNEIQTLIPEVRNEPLI